MYSEISDEMIELDPSESSFAEVSESDLALALSPTVSSLPSDSTLNSVSLSDPFGIKGNNNLFDFEFYY